MFNSIAKLVLNVAASSFIEVILHLDNYLIMKQKQWIKSIEIALMHSEKSAKNVPLQHVENKWFLS